MKIPKSFVLLVFAIFFGSQYSLFSGINHDFTDKVASDANFISQQSNDVHLSLQGFFESNLSNSSINLSAEFTLNDLIHITTSAGYQSPVKVCDGESLVITCTYVSGHVEYVFSRIRNGSESIVQHRSTNNVLELDSTEFLDDDIFYVKIFDINSTPASELESSRVTVEVLSLLNGATVFSGGTIVQENQVICSSEIPTTLTVTGDPSNVNFIYQWEPSTDNGENFNEIPGATNPSLAFVSGVFQTTTYRRSKRWNQGGTCIKYSEDHRIKVLENDPGSISSSIDPNTICYGEIPPEIINNTAGTINLGGISYGWQFSTDQKNWTDVAIVSLNYEHTQPLTTTTHFRRKILQQGSGQTCESYSNIITINVLEEVIVGMLSDAQTICEGNLPSVPISYDLDLQPQFNYQWQHSTNGEAYTDIYGENQKELTFDGNDIHFPTKTTHYRLAITKGEGGVRCTGYTDSTTIIVLPKSTQLSSNAPNNTICLGDDVTITAQGSNTFQFIVNGLIRSDASDNQLTLNNLTQTTTVTVRASNSSCSKLHTIVINVIKIDPSIQNRSWRIVKKS